MTVASLCRWPLMVACVVTVAVFPGRGPGGGAAGDRARQVRSAVVTTTPTMTPAPLPAPTRGIDPTTVPATPRPTRRAR